MKRFIAIFLFINVALFLWQCTKNKSDKIVVNFSKDCYAGYFTYNKFEGNNIIDVSTLPDNTYIVLTQLNSMVTLYFIDTHGRLISKSKVIMPFGSVAMNILPTPDGDFVISSATSTFIDSTAIYTSSLPIYSVGYASTFCNPYSGSSSGAVTFYPRRNMSKSFLTKVDKNGIVKWQKSFIGNGYTGNSLALMGNNILYLVNRSNLTDSLVHGLNDTIKYNYGSHNTLTLYNLDVNGITNWSKKMDNISGLVTYNSTHSGYLPPIQATLRATNNNILIQSTFDIILLDTKGNIVTKNNFANYYCTLFSTNNYYDLFFNAVLDQTSYAVYMPVVVSGQSKVLMYDFNNNITRYYTANSTTFSVNTFIEDINNNYILYDGTNLMKYDRQGNIIFNLNISSNSTQNTVLNTCDNGALVATSGIKTDSLGRSIAATAIKKIDKNGNF